MAMDQVSQSASEEAAKAKEILAEAMKAPSYPTRSLRFLQKSQQSSDPTTRQSSDHDTGHNQSNGIGSKGNPLHLELLIVGAGLGGLATAIALARRGHKVTVVEQAPALGEVGAGIQIPSNSAKLLLEWGLGPFLGDKVVEPEGISFRRWQNGKVIGYTRLIPDFRESFNAPYYVVHRAHFHEALHQCALELGVDVKINHKVIDYDQETASVILEDGKTMSADLVIAADGVKSLARKHILGDEDKDPLRTGFAAYRATVDVTKMQADPDTSWLLKKPGLNLWIGEDRHVMTYTIASGKAFNMVLSHVDHSDPSTWRPETAIDDMKEYFRGWDPQLTKIINMIEKTLKWPLISGRSADRWVSKSGKLAMLGDAAHAMVPYMSQGAAMAVEDGAALAEALGNIYFPDDIGTALDVFQTVRIKRSSQMQQASLINGKLWHFPDGAEQEARDAAMRPEVEGRHFIESPNQWSDPITQTWTYGYDTAEEVKRQWEEMGKRKKNKDFVNGSNL